MIRSPEGLVVFADELWKFKDGQPDLQFMVLASNNVERMAEMLQIAILNLAELGANIALSEIEALAEE